MQREVVAVEARTPLPDVERLLELRNISCALVQSSGRPIGVVSRTDLLRVGRGPDGAPGPLPATYVGAICKRAPITIDRAASVSEAAEKMLKERVHRLFVETSGDVCGVISTLDLLDAIVAEKVATQLREVMSHPLFTIPHNFTLAEATERLRQAHVSGLIVVDPEGWPVGVYSQADAVMARGHDGTMEIEGVMNQALVCVHDRAELHRAASMAKSSRARRVLVVEHRKAIGVLSPLDFARAIAG